MSGLVKKMQSLPESEWDGAMDALWPEFEAARDNVLKSEPVRRLAQRLCLSDLAIDRNDPTQTWIDGGMFFSDDHLSFYMKNGVIGVPDPDRPYLGCVLTTRCLVRIGDNGKISIEVLNAAAIDPERIPNVFFDESAGKGNGF